ncbi:SIS domain-containing protein [Candidatus Berkelbacteria bacterium]|nr:SIS domain-containing protein [Candidatus Berkelbacteria bacterium]
MPVLDLQENFQTLDRENMLQSIEDMPAQCMAAWEGMNSITLPTHYIQANQMILLGIGASRVAAEFVQAIALKTSTIPIEVLTGPDLPTYVGSQTLVIAISYTGNTREVAAAFRSAGERGAKLFGISAGGDLAALCRKYRAPYFSIQYGAQPRAAIGYLIMPPLLALERLGFVEFETQDLLAKGVETLRQCAEILRPSVSTPQNQAKQLAQRLMGKIPVILSPDFLRAGRHRFQMQLQENAKTFTVEVELPEGFHTFIADLKFPQSIASELAFVLLRSQYESTGLREEYETLGTQLKQGHLQIEQIKLKDGNTFLDEQFGFLSWADYVSFYLALLNGVDPSQSGDMINIQASKVGLKAFFQT